MNTSFAVAPEKTLFDVLRDLWRGKVYLIVASIFMLILAFVFISLAQDFYRAQMIIAPATSMGQGIGAGVNIGEGSIAAHPDSSNRSEAFLRFENIYDGVSVAKILIKDRKVVSALKLDLAFTFSKAKGALDAASLSEYLGRRVKLDPVSGTKLRKLTYLHPDKEFAHYMISHIHSVSDKIIRDSVLSEVNGRIIYLNDSLLATTNPRHRKNLTALLMEQERMKMLVSIDQPYAATIIEPAHVLSKPRWPDPYVIYPMFLFIGLLLGFVVYGMRHNG